MRTETLFFKTLFLVFLSFYIASYLISLMFVIYVESIDSTTVNFTELIKIVIFFPFLIGLIATTFFLPAVLLVSFIQWWMQNDRLKNVISFLLIMIYGFLILKVPSFRFYNTNLPDIIDETLPYLSLSIPATLLFLVLLFYLTQCKAKKKRWKNHQN